jgi:AcrR family transcriptional regulator
MNVHLYCVARPRSVSEEQILLATQQALLRLGPAGITLAEVASAVGLAPATLVQRYGSKRGLLLAFARSAAASAKAPFEQARLSVASPVLALRRALVQIATDLSSRQQVANSLAMLLTDLEDSELLTAARAHAENTQAAIKTLLDEALIAGELPQVNTEHLSLSVQAAWNGALVQWALRGGADFEAFLNEVIAPLLPAPGEKKEI